jgi:hypothetical protein
MSPRAAAWVNSKSVAFGISTPDFDALAEVFLTAPVSVFIKG